MRKFLLALALLFGAVPLAAQQPIQQPTSRYFLEFDHDDQNVDRFEFRDSMTAGWRNIGLSKRVQLDDYQEGTRTLQVRACNVSGCSPAAGIDVEVQTPPPPIPNAPSNLRIVIAQADEPGSGEPEEPQEPDNPNPQPVLFRADYSDFPNAGFGSAETEALNQRFTREFLPTGGPGGTAAHRLAMRYCAGCSDNGGQFNWGNRGNVVSSDAANGERRYYRFKMRLSGNHRGRPWGGGEGPSSLQNKLLIVGQGCGSNCRFILSYQTDSQGIRNFRLQKDGGVDVADTGSYPNNQWLNVQVELHTTNNSTGGYKLWVNNGNYNQPTAQKTGITFHGANHRYVWLGAFMNDGIRQDGSHILDLAAFEIGSIFDPTW